MLEGARAARQSDRPLLRAPKPDQTDGSAKRSVNRTHISRTIILTTMRNLTFILVLSLSIVACNGTEEVSIDPNVHMEELAQAVTDASSFRFQIFFSGPEIAIDDGVTLDSVDGQYRSPDAAQAAVRVKALGLTGSIGLLAYGDDVWQRGPVTTEWESVSTDELLTVKDMFAPDGLKELLRSDVSQVQLGDFGLTLDDFPGEAFTLLEGSVEGERLARLTLGGLEGGSTDIAVYGTGNEIRRIVLTQTGADDPRIWTIDLFAYGSSVDLEPAP